MLGYYECSDCKGSVRYGIHGINHDAEDENNKYVCPMCREGNHKLCAKTWCDCSHNETIDIIPSRSHATVSAGLPTLGKRR